MELSRLSLMNFRCFERIDFEFEDRVNFFVGPNAAGKTSILEAICVLLRLQSPRVAALGRIVRHGAAGFSVQGECSSRLLQFYFGSRRKKLALDRIEQTEATDYLRIGRLVYFGNADLEIAAGAGEARRKFLDFAGMQWSERYRPVYKRYNRALRARNALLKQRAINRAEIEAFNDPLAESGEELVRLRRGLIERLASFVPEAAAAISGGGEALGIEYVADIQSGNFTQELAAAYDEDLRCRATTAGPHRDDMSFSLNRVDSKHFASEGQQRTIVLALKLALCRLIESTSGEAPVLLFDDIFGELDPARRNGLFGAIPKTSQCFITTTALDWMRAAEGRVWRMS